MKLYTIKNNALILNEHTNIFIIIVDSNNTLVWVIMYSMFSLFSL